MLPNVLIVQLSKSIEYNNDFYSLGVTFFELLTGQLPFTTEDPLEMVYFHLVKQPPLAHTINPDIPPIISHIIDISENSQSNAVTSFKA